ncbi:MAG: TIGR03118 family protein, partial [Terracidiphilus sp.]
MKALRIISAIRKTTPAAFLAVSTFFTAGAAHAQYRVTNLVSNQEGWAKVTDPLLVNGWGISQPPDGPFWISDNFSGWSTLYDSNGTKVPLDVLIPTAGEDGPGSPTGTVFNASKDFAVKGASAPFLFDTLDGTISAWAPSITENSAQVVVTTKSASYTGLAISSKPTGNRLFAADFANDKVDIYDSSFKLVKSFTDPAVPTSFSVFGIQ